MTRNSESESTWEVFGGRDEFHHILEQIYTTEGRKSWPFFAYNTMLGSIAWERSTGPQNNLDWYDTVSVQNIAEKCKCCPGPNFLFRGQNW